MWSGLKQECRIRQLKVLGDDSIFGTERPYDLIQAQIIFERVETKLNMQNSAVSHYTDDLTFLGYQINYGAPSKPLDRWLAALLFPEEMDRSWSDVATRALGLLYACAGCNDRFD
ncbi:unnamed protein product, partial [Cylicostephanus goldi]